MCLPYECASTDKVRTEKVYHVLARLYKKVEAVAPLTEAFPYYGSKDSVAKLVSNFQKKINFCNK